MENKKTAIVTGGTKNQFPAMAVLALNIADKCPDIADELVIFHDGVSLEEQEKINKIFPTRFIEYKSPFTEVQGFTDTIKKYFSLMVFCKYECWRLLDEYKTVIWTDYDILILDSISEIKQRSDNYAKFVQNKYLVTKFERHVFWNFESDLKTFNILGECISCPLFVLYDDFPNYESFYNECLRLTQHFGSVLWTPEEAVISILFQQNNINYDLINPIIYVTQPFEYEKNKDKAKILHAAGQPKFWNGLNNEKWNSYYNKWLTVYNGIPFECKKEKRKITLKKLIKFIIPYGIIRLYQRKKYGK